MKTKKNENLMSKVTKFDLIKHFYF